VQRKPPRPPPPDAANDENVPATSCSQTFTFHHANYVSCPAICRENVFKLPEMPREPCWGCEHARLSQREHTCLLELEAAPLAIETDKQVQNEENQAADDLWPPPSSSPPFSPPTHPPTWGLDVMEPSETEIRSFIKDVKRAVSASDFHLFKSLIRNHQVVLRLDVLFDGLFRLLGPHRSLLDRFGIFLSDKDRAHFHRRLEVFDLWQRPGPSATPAVNRPRTMEDERGCCADCGFELDKPFKAKCGHIACFGCWVKAFEGATWARCPDCGAQVWKKQLVKLCL